MEIILANNQSMFDEEAANQVLLQLKKKPESVIAFATGGTPEGMYKKLAALYRNGNIDFSQIHAFNLDEFADIDCSHENSFFSFLKTNLYDSLNIKPRHIHPIRFTGSEEACTDYENEIKNHGGIDFAILGIGLNGHIGYNEPGTAFDSKTHLVQLTEQTIQSNSKLFKDFDIPKRGITMGIKTIMNARKIMLLANGEEKAEMIYKALYGRVSEEIPASILQLHSNLVVVLDERAAKYLKEIA